MQTVYLTEVVKSVKEALLSLTADDTAQVGKERLLVGKRALINGYEVIDVAEYNAFDGFAKTAGLAPYDEDY